MNYNVMFRASLALVTLASAALVASPAQALRMTGSLTGTVTEITGVQVSSASAPGPVVSANSETLVNTVGETVIEPGVLPDPLSAFLKDATLNSLSVGLISDETLLTVDEDLNSGTQLLAPVVPVTGQALAEVGLDVDAGPIAQANANACVGVGVNDSVPGCTGQSPEEIPTPALLPGLIALGAGVFRKHKAEQAEQAEA